MKHLFWILLAGLLLGACTAGKNAATTLTTSSFQVRGLCGMCKTRIETTALSTKGVKSAVWNNDTEMLTIQFDPAKTTQETVQQNIANVGHDTGNFKAPDAVYNKLPGCCKYRE